MTAQVNDETALRLVTPASSQGLPGRGLRGGGQLDIEEAQLGRVSDDVDRLDGLAAQAEDQHASEAAANEAQQRGLTADRMRDQGRSGSPKVQQVPGDPF